MPKYKVVATHPLELSDGIDRAGVGLSYKWLSAIDRRELSLGGSSIVSVAGVLWGDIPAASTRHGLGRGARGLAVRPELTIDDFDVEIVPDA